MKVTADDNASKSIQSFESTSPSNGAVPTQMTASDNLPTNMNKPELATRGSRADSLVEMAGDDGYRLGTEAPRHGKMPG